MKKKIRIFLGNIIASKAGIVTKIIAENGTAKLHEGSYIEKGMIAIEGIIESEYINPAYVHGKGILRVKNTYTYEVEEKYIVHQKAYTGKKRYGIGIKLNNKEYLLKYLPKKHIYDINKKEGNLKHIQEYFKFIFVKYVEYDLIKNQRNYDELCKLCKEKYNEYINTIKTETSVISNEKYDVLETQDGIKLVVTFDLEEDVGVFEKTGE